MDTSEIVLSKPTRYKNISTSETKTISKKDCVGITCKTSPYCFC